MKRRRKYRRDLLYLLPSLTGFSVFFIVPFFCSFYYAFIDNAFTRRFAGFDNFIALFNNEYFRLAMKNTLLFTAAAVPLSMLLSTAAALLIASFAARLRFVKSALFLPVVLPSAAVVTLFSAYLTDFTPFSSLLLIFIWKYGGLNIMLLLTALAGMDKDMLDAARIDGAGTVKTAVFVTLPNLSPTLFFTLVVTVVNSLKIFRESYLLYGAYPDESVYMLQNYLNNHFGKLNYQNISTVAIVFAVVVYSVVAAVFAAEKRRSERIW